jgi:cell wall assembly regulator SMI1
MSVRATVLNMSLLEQLEARLARHAPEVLSELGDRGASAEDLARADEALGEHTLSGEALTWWRWRNPPAEVEIVPVITVVPLALALNARASRLTMRERIAADAPRDSKLADPNVWWSPGWLPFVGPFQQNMVCVDCDVPEGEPTPVRHIDWQAAGRKDYDAPVAPSIGSLVERWIALLDAGAYVRENGAWWWFSFVRSLSGELPGDP